MSKISLSPNASGTGTFTIQSPAGNTNRTFTLPDADGELSVGGGGSIELTAAGDISNGDAVGITPDGLASVLSIVAQDAVQFEAGSANFVDGGVVYDTNSNKVVIVYSDAGNSNRVTGVVGTISSGAITFGTPVVINSTVNCYTSCATFDSTNNKVVCYYRDSGAGAIKSHVLTVSGTSLTVGTANTVHTSANAYSEIKCTFDSSANRTVVFARETNGITEAFVGTVSGTSISHGSPVVFESDTLREIDCTFDSTNNKVIVFYRRTADDIIYAKVGTVSGTSISFGARASALSSGTGFVPKSTFDSENGKVVMSYITPYSTTPRTGYISVGTVSGTSISFGAIVEFDGDDPSAGTDNRKLVFNPSSNKVEIYFSAGTSISLKTGTVSGTSITIDPSKKLFGDDTGYLGAAYDPVSNLTIVAIRDSAGDAIVVNSGAVSAFLGLAESDITDGANGSITVVGGTNESQTGLAAGSAVYSDGDGTISDVANGTSIGVALSATKILLT